MSDHSNEPFDELMRRALAEEADRIEPADALPEIRARAHAQRRPVARRPWLLTVGAAAVGTAAAIGAFTVFNGNQNTANDGDAVAGAGTPTTAAPSTTTATTTPAPSPVPTAATLPPSTDPKATTAPTERGKPEQFVKGVVVPVYWLGNRTGSEAGADPKPSVSARSAVKLYRTWAKVSGRPAEQAVRIMTSKAPSDPDYYSVWRGAEVNAITRSDGVVTVDFKELPEATLDPDVADVAAQQLIYTVQGALHTSSEPVQITQRGRSGARLFGQIDTTKPLGRAQQADVQALVWINSPAEGETTATNLTVQGTANAFEATVNYQVTNLKTRKTTVKDYVLAKEGQKFSPFVIQLKLAPGPYQIDAYLISAEDGTISDADSKRILVR
ncbi:MAG TPA: Gmad2 immunoglobulin-like domain-containing protein [Kribbella sp.]|nr:Gmad2 immunoglobulin-like domain-containing protein [Kribbella sp.]